MSLLGDRYMAIQPHIWLSAAVALAILGCSGRPSRVEAPDLDPKGVAQRAIERYDKNDDGRLTGEELSPGLNALARTADADSDGALTETEIADILKRPSKPRSCSPWSSSGPTSTPMTFWIAPSACPTRPGAGRTRCSFECSPTDSCSET